jgi:hypothetical protein
MEKIITEMYAFVVVDPADGSEGIPSFSHLGMHHPLVGADMDRVKSLIPIAERLFPGKWRLLHFENPKDITMKVRNG